VYIKQCNASIIIFIFFEGALSYLKF